MLYKSVKADRNIKGDVIMSKDSKTTFLERATAIVIGGILGVILSFFISIWNTNGTMKVTQWATFMGLAALVLEQINLPVIRLTSTFVLATFMGSMIGLTMKLGNKALLILAVATILLMTIAMAIGIHVKRKRENELWDRINTRMVEKEPTMDDED